MQHIHDDSGQTERRFNLGWREIFFAVLLIAISLILSIALSQLVASALLT